MTQCDKRIRRGYAPIGVTASSSSNVHVTAYENENRIVVVAVNTSSSPQTITLGLGNGRVGAFTKYTTSGGKNVSDDGVVALGNDPASVTLDAQSVTTFVSREDEEAKGRLHSTITPCS
jgi:O-glycosyl hydrolase